MKYIFEKTVIVNLGSKKSARNKGDGLSRKKNTAGLVQDNGELVEKGEKEKFLDVWVSTRGRIIRKTRKT